MTLRGGRVLRRAVRARGGAFVARFAVGRHRVVRVSASSGGAVVRRTLSSH